MQTHNSRPPPRSNNDADNSEMGSAVEYMCNPLRTSQLKIWGGGDGEEKATNCSD